MPIPLDKWQERLESHFAHIASVRSYSDFPLFALEHGLNDDEFEEITALLHAQLADGWKLGRHWLVWVAYATEQGYDYDGDEYWASFEQRTPRWRETITSTRRNQLRTWFSKFHATYHGVKPSGPWAEWFSIISWPITHAILPRYLQGQFAKTLYDLRHQLAHLETLSPRAVGELLAANTWDATSRFQEFLQQEELAGRIVLALLSDRTVDGQSPIYPQTLERLVTNLEEVRTTREWLTETRRLIADRLKGTSRGFGGAANRGDVAQNEGKSAPRNPVSLRPTLELRRTPDSTWSVVVNIPNFASLARSQPKLHALLTSTRCKISGTGDTWLPSGWLLSSSPKRVKTWPGGAKSLVTFERPNPDLDRFIVHETRLSAGPAWLFRIGDDGLAREIGGRVVRPGRNYVLLSEAEISLRASFVAPCKVDCSGINAALLSMPITVSFETMRALQQWGLQIARTVRIWPAGLSARSFDGEGRSEWLTTERPCFGIVHDHPVDAYSLRLDYGKETLVNASTVDTPVFVKLEALSAGRHTLSVKARTDAATAVSSTAEGVILLDVREPEPWIAGTTSHAGLAISLDSDTPSLDRFWEATVGVSILGPAGHQVTCAMSLLGPGGKELLSEPIGTFDLPVTPADWLKKFSTFVKEDRRTWTYPEATSGRFVVSAEELGEYSLRLERNVKPLRWACRNTHKATTVRLIDDTGSEDAPACRFFSLRAPVTPIILNAETITAGFEVPVPGGVFEARHGKFQDTLNVSNPTSGHGFADLAVTPDLSSLESDSFPIATLLEIVKLWSESRVLGPLVTIRRNHVIERLANRLYGRLCGQRWAEVEGTFLAGSRSGFERQTLERSVGGPNAFSTTLVREYDRMEYGTSAGKHWFTGVAGRFQVSSDPTLCEFALQFASHPHELPPLPQVILDELLRGVKENGVLLRGARLVAVLAGARNPGPFGSVFPRWSW